MSQDDRRLEVSNAAWRVIAREGLDRASMRAIAQELGSTTGVVTHYFRNKDALLLFALHQVTARLRAIMVSATRESDGADRLVALLAAFLPIDEERLDILKVWVAFLGYAVGRDGLMAEHRQSAGELRQIVIRELAELQKAGTLRPDFDPDSEANVLLALANGISLDSLLQTDALTPEQQLRAIARSVDALRQR